CARASAWNDYSLDVW
nr:immunoglobulin heavy chain junction region [Macaca mulatta]MOW98666.1 immunoglobulin heavy chain junction region [Macaca mulatta]MOW98684.1 immunoglobulin heavy chain junction region [Macaca mulatta]MOW98781.1 immunoglobulin heavy chain junction region [Macaca mulatta]MOW98822.1 immunoglobulin heavy chain junction region [Macaca mulatta]